VGVTEMLGELEHAGARIVECPVALEPGAPGGSPWKTLRAGLGHLGLMARLTVRRMMRRKP